VVELYARGYAGMTDVEGNLARVRDAGYELVGHFRLAEAAWWDEYFGPLEAKLPALVEKYAGDDAAPASVDDTRLEIALRRRYPESFGYEFFVARAA
jgi:hypothetical protein